MLAPKNGKGTQLEEFQGDRAIALESTSAYPY